MGQHLGIGEADLRHEADQPLFGDDRIIDADSVVASLIDGEGIKAGGGVPPDDHRRLEIKIGILIPNLQIFLELFVFGFCPLVFDEHRTQGGIFIPQGFIFLRQPPARKKAGRRVAHRIGDSGARPLQGSHQPCGELADHRNGGAGIGRPQGKREDQREDQRKDFEAGSLKKIAHMAPLS